MELTSQMVVAATAVVVVAAVVVVFSAKGNGKGLKVEGHQAKGKATKKGKKGKDGPPPLVESAPAASVAAPAPVPAPAPKQSSPAKPVTKSSSAVPAPKLPAAVPAAAPVRAAPAPAPVLVPVPVPVPVVAPATVAAPAQEAKKPKDKETPEAKQARLERQRLRAIEISDTQTASRLAAEESENAGYARERQPSQDGWAVVGGGSKQSKKGVNANGNGSAAVGGSSHHSTSAPFEAAADGGYSAAAAAVAGGGGKAAGSGVGAGSGSGGVAAVAPTVATGGRENSTPVAPEIELVTSVISVDAKKIGILIGPKGAHKIGIQEKTGVTIELPAKAGPEKEATGPVDVTVKGSQEGVFKASRAIRDLTTKGYCALLGGENFSEGHIVVAPGYLADIIGIKGASIRAIQDHCGVHLKVPQGIARGDATPVRVDVAGQREKVVLAKSIIKELTKYRHHPVTHPNVVHSEMTDISSTYHGSIIGPKGSEIRHIQNNFKVSVYFPNEESAYQNVLVVGEKAGVEAAERYIRKIVENAITRQKEREQRGDGADDDARRDRADFEQDDGHEDWMNAYDASKSASTTLNFADVYKGAEQAETKSGAPKSWATNPLII